MPSSCIVGDLRTPGLHMERTLIINTAQVNELVRDVIGLKVNARNGVLASAVIWPTLLTPKQVSGVVEWSSSLLVSSMVSTRGVNSPWMQRLLLAGAAFSPGNRREVPEFSTEQWSSLEIFFSDFDGDANYKVRVFLNKVSWGVVISSTNPLNPNVHLSIPTELRSLDAGPLLLAMTSRIAQHQSPSAQKVPRAGG